jgi:hypothetical protein
MSKWKFYGVLAIMLAVLLLVAVIYGVAVAVSIFTVVCLSVWVIGLALSSRSKREAPRI